MSLESPVTETTTPAPDYSQLPASAFPEGADPSTYKDSLSAPETPAKPERPAHIPEKFWDADAGTIRVDEMAKSYAELEKMKSAPKAEDKPSDDADKPNDLTIEPAKEEAPAEAEADRVFAKTLEAVTQRPTAEAFVRAKSEFEATGEIYDPAKSYMGDARLEEAADVLASVDLHEMANDYARLMAFQKTGPAVEAFEKAMKYIPIVKALYVPFLRTPLNLVRAGMVDRNPALAWLTKENRAAFKTYFAALDGQEKALSRGGAEADIVMARMVSGMALMGTAAMLFANGDLVGKRTPAEEEDGVKSYSIRLGGRWYQYSTLSPVAEMIGITADLYQTK